MNLNDLNTLDEITDCCDLYYKKICKSFQSSCIFEILLAFLTLYSVSYSIKKSLGFVIPLVLAIAATVFGVFRYSSVQKQFENLDKAYKTRLDALRESSDINERMRQSKHYNDYNRLSPIPNKTKFGFRCVAVMLILAALMYGYDSQKVFNAAKWKKGGFCRLLMVEDLLDRQNDLYGNDPYYLPAMSEQQIHDLLYDEHQKTVPVDITVNMSKIDTTVNHDKAVLYYVYTTKSGKNYWLVLYYAAYGTNNQRVFDAELLSSGMTRNYGGGNYGPECRLWF